MVEGEARYLHKLTDPRGLDKIPMPQCPKQYRCLDLAIQNFHMSMDLYKTRIKFDKNEWKISSWMMTNIHLMNLRMTPLSKAKQKRLEWEVE